MGQKAPPSGLTLPQT